MLLVMHRRECDAERNAAVSSISLHDDEERFDDEDRDREDDVVDTRTPLVAAAIVDGTQRR